MISFVALVDHFAHKLKSKMASIAVLLIIAAMFTAAFLFFADFAFGMGGKNKEMSS